MKKSYRKNTAFFLFPTSFGIFILVFLAISSLFLFIEESSYDNSIQKKN